MKQTRPAKPNEAVLKVIHRGNAKIVGKLIEVGKAPLPRGLMLYHEESGTQALVKYGGPGIDVVVVHWCIGHGVTLYVHAVKGEARAHSIPMEAAVRKGQRKRFDDRDRYIVPWESFVEISRPPVIPWIVKEIVIEPDDVTIPPAHTKPASQTHDSLTPDRADQRKLFD